MRLIASMGTLMARRSVALALVCCSLSAWGADVTTTDAGHSKYVPQPVSISDDAPYRLPDGSIYFVGDSTMDPLLQELNALFIKTHPGVRFTMLTRSPPVGFDGIVAGVSAFAPIAHDAWESEIEPLRRQTGKAPLDIHVGANRPNPPAIYVNARNSLAALSMDDVARIFTSGQPAGDLSTWSQVGIDGPLARHVIHVYGTRNDGRAMTSIRDVHFGSHPIVRHYEALATDADVLDAVANDRYAIGLVGFVEPATIPRQVRFVALKRSATDKGSTARPDEVRTGAYPLSPFLHLYVRRLSDQPLDPFVKEYIRLALSAEGQQVIDRLVRRRESYVSLTPNEAAAELKKID
jgi:phosphate transport system substrate-binding protein